LIENLATLNKKPMNPSERKVSRMIDVNGAVSVFYHRPHLYAARTARNGCATVLAEAPVKTDPAKSIPIKNVCGLKYITDQNF